MRHYDVGLFWVLKIKDEGGRAREWVRMDYFYTY